VILNQSRMFDINTNTQHHSSDSNSRACLNHAKCMNSTPHARRSKTSKESKNHSAGHHLARSSFLAHFASDIFRVSRIDLERWRTPCTTPPAPSPRSPSPCSSALVWNALDFGGVSVNNADPTPSNKALKSLGLSSISIQTVLEPVDALLRPILFCAYIYIEFNSNWE
jgi:hypothetical protein